MVVYNVSALADLNNFTTIVCRKGIYMRIKTGETAFVDLTVDVQYRCSFCGKDNLIAQTITSSAYTPTIMGFNLDRNISRSAMVALNDKLSAISDKRNPKRFRAVGFTCKCKNCGNAEPWARMNYKHLEKTNTISMCALMYSLMFSLMSLGAKSIKFMHILSYVILAVSATICACINVYKFNNTKKMERLLTTLPQESFPSVVAYSGERHKEFEKSLAKFHDLKEASYDIWVCKECGTNNSMQYSQCKKCGKFKGL